MSDDPRDQAFDRLVAADDVRLRDELEPAFVHVEAARVLAETVVCAIGSCEEDGNPLTQLQQVSVVTHALLAFDGMSARIDTAANTADELRRMVTLLGRRRPGWSARQQ